MNPTDEELEQAHKLNIDGACRLAEQIITEGLAESARNPRAKAEKRALWDRLVAEAEYQMGPATLGDMLSLDHLTPRVVADLLDRRGSEALDPNLDRLDRFYEAAGELVNSSGVAPHAVVELLRSYGHCLGLPRAELDWALRTVAMTGLRAR